MMAKPTVVRDAAKPNTPDTYERILSVSAVILLCAVAIALGKGRPQWSYVPVSIWAHLATISVALILTPVMLLRRRGDILHRQLGRVWCAAMILTALISFAARYSNHGKFGFIHLISVWVLIQVPLIAVAARKHDVQSHRARVRAMVTGALLIAGFFTFPFNRMLGQWLFS